MTSSLQNITPEQVNALNKQSRAAYDAALKDRQTLISKRPSLRAALDQSVHPQSLCGCGSQQNICGYFAFEGCGSGCGPHPETVHITTHVAMIGPNAPQQQGTSVRFVGQAAGTQNDLGNYNVDIPNVYLQGTVPDAENLIGIQLSLQLSIEPGSVNLALSEGPRLLAVLVIPPQYAAMVGGQFSGAGYGTFTAT